MKQTDREGTVHTELKDVEFHSKFNSSQRKKGK